MDTSPQTALQGQFEYASRTSLILEEYEDVIDLPHTQSLIAMASYCCRNFSRCSRSIMKLGRLDASISHTSQQLSYGMPNFHTGELIVSLFHRIRTICHCLCDVCPFKTRSPAHHNMNQDHKAFTTLAYALSYAQLDSIASNVCFASGRQE